MGLEKPSTYRQATWDKISPRLSAMSDDQMVKLTIKAGLPTVHSRQSNIDQLLERGGFLLVEFGLINDSSLTIGTYFMHDIYEYVLDGDAAKQLAAGEDVTVRYTGRDFAEILPAAEVIADLRTSDIFDQHEFS